MRKSSNKELKVSIRQFVWNILEEKNVPIFPRPVYGRIPSFRGQEEAAQRLFQTPEWRSAKVIKVNPDAPQQPVRLRALEERKILIVPSPRLRLGFIILEPEKVHPSMYKKLSTISGFMSVGKQARLEYLLSFGRVDLIVEGSVAVNEYGERLGKGEGYGELEYAILAELGLVGEHTPIATTVHDLQVLDRSIPQDPWDVPIDIIATPTRLIRCTRRRTRPRGILWEFLDIDKLNEIPLLREVKTWSNTALSTRERKL